MLKRNHEEMERTDGFSLGASGDPDLPDGLRRDVSASAVVKPGEDQGAESVGEDREAGGEKSVEEQLEEKDREARENYERWLRCMAEFENYKKRQERERQEFCKFANESVISEMLPTLDNLDRAMEHLQKGSSVERVREGVELTRTGLMSVLEKQGLNPIEALGRKFDPHFHEAVMQLEDAEAEDQTVVQEVQKGYVLNGRVIRPVRVVVSRKPS